MRDTLSQCQRKIPDVILWMDEASSRREKHQVRNHFGSVQQGKTKALSNNVTPLGLHKVNSGRESGPRCGMSSVVSEATLLGSWAEC